MLGGAWYFNKVLIISLSVAITLSAAWLIYKNRNYLIRNYSTPNGTTTSSTPQPTEEPRKYPFMAFLNIQHDNSSGNCGGTLIGQRHILTAAHCLQGASSVWIILGTDNIEHEEKSALYIESETFIVHENYDNTTYDNDIALIYLDHDVSIDENVNAISFFPPNKGILNNSTSFLVLGWGLIDFTQGLNDELLVKFVTIVDRIFCFSPTETETNFSKICAFGKTGPCHGDSGGPLIFDDIQVGIVSRGDKNCNADIPTIYTDTTYYWPWIIQNLN